MTGTMGTIVAPARSTELAIRRPRRAQLIPALLAGSMALLMGPAPAAWKASQTISRAVEIRDGVVLNPSILSFQHRDKSYPHPVRTERLGRLTSNALGGAGFN